MTSPQRNKLAAARITRELFNHDGDASAARVLLAPAFSDHSAPAREATDASSFVRRALALQRGLPGLVTRTEQLLAEGDLVSERWRRTWHLGGRRLEATGFTQYRFSGGRAIELWGDPHSAALPPSQADELTPHELRVATLVVEGRSNPEVATLLRVSRKTIESHLSQIYRKLGIRSRMDLARVLGPHLDWARPDLRAA